MERSRPGRAPVRRAASSAWDGTGQRVRLPMVMALALLGLLVLPGRGGAEPAATGTSSVPASASRLVLREQYRSLIQRIRAGASRVDDLSCRFYIQEYTDGELAPETMMELKWRRQPRAAYLKTPAQKNREVIWREEWGKLKVHAGTYMDIHLSLDPKGSLAMRGSRHPITVIGFDRIVNIMEDTVGRADADPSYPLELEEAGLQSVHGEPAQCYRVRIDKAARPEAYGYRIRLCFHPQLSVPVRVEVEDIEDGALRLVEAYSYTDVRVNVGLTDADFDTTNPKYGY